jgi:hypothetical protein
VTKELTIPLLERSDLRYEYDWSASPGDNPKLIEDDSHHLSRREGYEMLRYLNGLRFSEDVKSVVYGKGKDISIEDRLYVEWMLKEQYKSTAPGRGTVTTWINANWRPLKKVFTRLKPKR